MAGQHYNYNSKLFTLATTGGWKTLLLLEVPAGRRVFIENFGLQPLGVNNSAKPVRVRLVRVSDQGSGGTDDSANIGISSDVPEAPDVTILQGDNSDGFTTNPTEIGSRPLVRAMSFHPQQPSDLPTLGRGSFAVGGGGRLALQVHNDGGDAVQSECEISWEE